MEIISVLSLLIVLATFIAVGYFVFFDKEGRIRTDLEPTLAMRVEKERIAAAQEKARIDAPQDDPVILTEGQSYVIQTKALRSPRKTKTPQIGAVTRRSRITVQEGEGGEPKLVPAGGTMRLDLEPTLAKRTGRFTGTGPVEIKEDVGDSGWQEMPQQGQNPEVFGNPSTPPSPPSPSSASIQSF